MTDMTKNRLSLQIGVVTDIRIGYSRRQDVPRGDSRRQESLSSTCRDQCAMLSIPGVGEAMFSITSSPTNTGIHGVLASKKCGCVTEWLHSMEVGQQITIRGPYGQRVSR